MMHQIRTPLNIIGGFAQVLNENYHELPPDETSNIIHMMQDNTRKFVRISRMLVAASASDDEKAIKKHEFCCNSLCRDIVNSIRLTSPHLVKLSFETTLPDTFTINSDEDKVRAVLTELLDNANKFTQRGTITLTCSQPDAHTVKMTVSDTGIGIAEEDRHQIFTQFSKIDDFTEGVGLGLPLSKRTAKLLGGDLILDPHYHDGSSFVFTLRT